MAVQTFTRNTRPGEYALPYIQDVLGGQYLPGQEQGNPYLDRTFDMAALRTQNQLASEFAGAGRNVDASQGLRSQQLGDLATQIYGGAYDAERNRQNALVPYAGSDTTSTSPLYRDRTSELLGGLMLGGELLGSYGDLYDRFFGDDAGGQGGGASGDAAGQVGGLLGGAGAAGSAAGGAVAGGGVSAGGGTIGSGVLGSSGTGVASGGAGAAGAAAGGLGALAGGAHAGALGGLGATTAATEAALLGTSMPTLAPLGGAAAGGAGAAGAGAAGAGAAGGTSALGLGVAGLAALPIALGMAGVYGDPMQDETSQLRRAYEGLGVRSVNTQWGQELLRLPDGTHIDAESVKHRLDDRYGKEPNESVIAWLMSQPRVAYTTPQLGRRRVGPNAPIADYR